MWQLQQQDHAADPPTSAPADDAALAAVASSWPMTISPHSSPGGGRLEVTYASCLVYTLLGGSPAGTAHGQGISSISGTWWGITPNGTPMPASAQSTSSTTQTSSSSRGLGLLTTGPFDGWAPSLSAFPGAHPSQASDGAPSRQTRDVPRSTDCRRFRRGEWFGRSRRDIS